MRTDQQIFDREPITATLGNRDFLIQIQTRVRTRNFRKQLQAALGEAEEIGAFIQAAIAAAGGMDIDAGDLDISRLTALLHRFIGQGADDLLDLIYEYDPALKAEKDWIEENAFDEQILALLVEIFKAVFVPFARSLQNLGSNKIEMKSPE